MRAGQTKQILLLISIFTAGFIAAKTARADSSLAVGFDASGLSSLKYGSIELLTEAHPQIDHFKAGADADKHDPFKPSTDTFDPATRTLTQTYNWGETTIAYRPAADQLFLDVTVSNKCKFTVKKAWLDLLRIKFPSTPAGSDWEHHYGVTSIAPDGLPALLADWGTARMALCNEDIDKPVNFGFAPKDDSYAVMLTFNGSTLTPGTSITAKLSIRLAGENQPGWTVARDLLHKFAEKYPSELNWSDRRPIGSAFLATSVAGYKNNPRGWFLDPTLDTTTPKGRDEFHDRVMKYADQVIAHCKLMNAQGVIIWDLEGQEMPHATSYLADARILSKTAPEMDSIADRFFKKLSDAGLRTGVTIRPTRVEPAPDGHGWTQVEVPNPVAEMDSKITYAQNRWGCTLFYIDSNVNFTRDPNGKIVNDPAMAAADFQTLSRHHKGCLLMPEHKTARYYAYTAPYSELRLGFAGTPPEIRETYPHAFSVIRVVDGPPLDSVTDQLVSSINAGDILLFRPWWDDPATAQIKQIYDLTATRKNDPQ